MMLGTKIGYAGASPDEQNLDRQLDALKAAGCGRPFSDEGVNRAGNPTWGLRDVPEIHLCCGSAGTYNILQPEIATRLRARKVGNIERVRPDLIASGNIGCLTQIAVGTSIPLVHTVALLDWATGGPVLAPIEALAEARSEVPSRHEAADWG